MRTILSKLPDWSRYIKGQETVTIGYPWVALGAILALERILQPSWRVLEFGCGGSTIFWANHCQRVQSYETDPGWVEKIRARVDGRATVTHCATVGEIMTAVGNMPAASVDLLVVDHADPERHALKKNPNRLPLALAALPTLKVGGWLLVDNYDCFGMQRFDWSAFSVFTFDELGGVSGMRRYSGRGTRLGQRLI